jgi:hypothetical protein
MRADENQDSGGHAARTEVLIDKIALTRQSDNSNAEAKKAWVELRDIGPESFPKVVEHLQDKRTSFTADSGSTDETWTVGRACFDVLRCNLEPYNVGMYSSCFAARANHWRPQYCKVFLKTPKKANTWLAAHQNKSLVDLQIEVLEWVTSDHPEEQRKVSPEDRRELLDKLDELKRTRKPLRAAVPWAM